jgi:hypothetical protein
MSQPADRPAPSTTQPAAPAPVLLRIGWIGLTIIGLFFVFASLNDLRAIHTSGLPADHTTAFAKQAGTTFAAVKQATPGVARYLTNLEYGYAVHELTFALLFLALVLIPFRRRERWAWVACWAVLIASVGYSLTFGTHDPKVLRYSLVTDIAIPALLLLSAPSFFTKARSPATPSTGK